MFFFDRNMQGIGAWNLTNDQKKLKT